MRIGPGGSMTGDQRGVKVIMKSSDNFLSQRIRTEYVTDREGYMVSGGRVLNELGKRRGDDETTA